MIFQRSGQQPASNRERGSSAFLLIILGMWTLHSLLLQTYARALITYIPCFAGGLLLTFVAVRSFLAERRFLFPAVGAGIVIVLKPIYLLSFALRDMPGGMIPLVGSFVLFGLGTAFALQRSVPRRAMANRAAAEVGDNPNRS